MAWISKVSEHDYVIKRRLPLTVGNRRNGQDFTMTNEQMIDLFQKRGVHLDREQIVAYCIEQAIIPHPVEEYE